MLANVSSQCIDGMYRRVSVPKAKFINWYDFVGVVVSDEQVVNVNFKDLTHVWE